MIVTGFAEAIKNSEWHIGVMEFMDSDKFEASDPDPEMLDMKLSFMAAGAPDPPEEVVAAFEDPEFNGPITFRLNWNRDWLRLYGSKLKWMLMRPLPDYSSRFLGFEVEDGRGSFGPPVFKFRNYEDSKWLVVYTRLSQKVLTEYMKPASPQEYEKFLAPNKVVNVVSFHRIVDNYDTDYGRGLVAVCLKSSKDLTHAPIVDMRVLADEIISDIRQTSVLHRLGGTCLEVSSIAERQLFVETLRTEFGREVARIVLGLEEGEPLKYFSGKNFDL